MILILGKNGYISKRFQAFFDYKGIKYLTFEMGREQEEYRHIWLQLRMPQQVELIINCVGYTGKPNVDVCEDNKRECISLNTVFPEVLSEHAKLLKIPLLHISSGCIYNDMFIKSTDKWIRLHNEGHPPSFSFQYGNGSWYSGTKALGETLVRKTWDRHYICRLRMPFNHIDEDKNYISKLLKYPKVWSAPNSLTNVDEFVQSCYLLYFMGAEYGTYNMTNPDAITAKEVLELAAEYGIKKDVYEYFESQEEFNKVIKTPRSNCVLDTTKLEKVGCGMRPVRESLRKCFESWNKKEDIIFW